MTERVIVRAAAMGVMYGNEPYLAAAATLLRESGCTVATWRNRNSGVARVRSDGWEIEVPEPRGPVSFAVLAHEVAHQLLHRPPCSKPRWLEEIEAEEYALSQFERFALPGIEEARRNVAKHLRHAAAKAARRAAPNTAEAILDRMPAWVWNDSGPLPLLYDRLTMLAPTKEVPS